MGCEGCKIGAKGQVEAMAAARAAALNYANETGQTVAIFSEGGEFEFAEIGTAIAGGKPVREVVSPNK